MRFSWNLWGFFWNLFKCTRFFCKHKIQEAWI